MALIQSPTTLMFMVNRREPELITPAKPTPHEFKPLSEIDDQNGLRFHVPGLAFYSHNPSMQGIDPAKVIRDAIAKALVFYYPLAGRLREGPNRKLIVECTGEGILFIEADADVTLEQFGYPLAPPFPCIDELLFDVPGSREIVNCPLVLIQVTRLKCGGFIFGIRVNHTMSDGAGIYQFMSAIAEIGKGVNAPSVLPTWERQAFSARNPPKVIYPHPEYDGAADPKVMMFPFDNNDVCHRCFYFSPTDISTLRRLYVPLQLRHCSTFEILIACVWKCRVIALQPHPTEEMRLISIVNLRGKLKKHIVPAGYYGNAFVTTLAAASAKQMSESPMSFALELVRNAKDIVTEEYVRSLADLLVTRDSPVIHLNMNCYFVSDLTRVQEVDFGWGKAAYTGTSTVPLAVFGYHISLKNKNGENGIMVSHCLPTQAMERFAKELHNMLQHAKL